jgi:hypothetical protein
MNHKISERNFARTGKLCFPIDSINIETYLNMSKRAVKGFAGNRRMKKSLMKSLKFTN